MITHLERLQILAFALIGLLVASATLFIGYSRSDNTRVLLWLCEETGVCAGRSLARAARNLAWSGRPEDLNTAIIIYQHLSTGDPAEPENWANLGDAFASAGRTADAEAAFDNATRLGPNRPEILMRAINWAFEEGHLSLATKLVRRQLALVRDYDLVLFRLLRISGLTVEESLAQCLIDERDPLAAYLVYLIGEKDPNGAEAVWRRMEHLDLIKSGDLPSYVALLLETSRYQEAIRAQRSLADNINSDWPDDNMVFNGGFESDPTGARLDWVIKPHPRVTTTIDKEFHATGDRSLRVRFPGTDNVLFANVSQTILVKPGQVYELQASVRADQASTNEGLRFEITGTTQDGKQFSAETNSIIGTQDWQRVNLQFATPAGAEQVTLALVRRRSEKFDSKIKGTVWVDDVSLR